MSVLEVLIFHIALPLFVLLLMEYVRYSTKE